MAREVINIQNDLENISDSYNWEVSQDVRDLLDVVVGILAEEYVETVGDNPELFVANKAVKPPKSPSSGGLQMQGGRR